MYSNSLCRFESHSYSRNTYQSDPLGQRYRATQNSLPLSQEIAVISHSLPGDSLQRWSDARRMLEFPSHPKPSESDSVTQPTHPCDTGPAESANCVPVHAGTQYCLHCLVEWRQAVQQQARKKADMSLGDWELHWICLQTSSSGGNAPVVKLMKDTNSPSCNRLLHSLFTVLQKRIQTFHYGKGLLENIKYSWTR